MFAVAYLLPLGEFYAGSLFSLAYGLSVILGAFALSGLGTFVVFRQRIAEVLGPVAISLVGVAYGLALYSDYFGYAWKLVSNLPFNSPFDVAQAQEHIIWVSVFGLGTALVIRIMKLWIWPQEPSLQTSHT